jgi:hypothetical protein
MPTFHVFHYRGNKPNHHPDGQQTVLAEIETEANMQK